MKSGPMRKGPRVFRKLIAATAGISKEYCRCSGVGDAANYRIESLESRVMLSGDFVETLGQFGTNSSGQTPTGALVSDAAGNLFGTAQGGGSFGDGAIFEIPAGRASVVPVASFDGSNGSFPSNTLTIDSEGNLYGATSYGGADGGGTIFELPHGSSNIRVIAPQNGGVPEMSARASSRYSPAAPPSRRLPPSPVPITTHQVDSSSTTPAIYLERPPGTQFTMPLFSNLHMGPPRS
jgi:uncharacterized repeat protein (TIGR03803 family)